jgi:hypothetical protein
MTTARSLSVVVAMGLVALSVGAPACPVGPSSLVSANSNVAVVLFRLRAGDFVSMRVDDVERALVANDSTAITVLFEVETGLQRGRVVHHRNGLARCGGFDVVVDDAGREEVVVDVESMALCVADDDAGVDDAGADDSGVPEDAGEPRDAGVDDAGEEIDGGEDLDAGDELDGGDGQDAGEEPDGGSADAGFSDAGEPDAGPPPVLFVLFREDLRLGLCLIEPCHVITTVLADGTITYENQDAEPQEANLPLSDLLALVDVLLSDTVDLLFAGEDPLCPDPSPGGVDTVLFQRVLDVPPIEDVTKDVSGCLSTTVLGLRTRMSTLRLLAFGIE